MDYSLWVSLNYEILWFTVALQAGKQENWNILPLEISHIDIAHLCNQFNHVFALLNYFYTTFQNHLFLSK